MLFPGLTLFLIFILWTTYKRKKADHEDEKRNALFWKREFEANSVRKKDLSDLKYIQIPLDKLPFSVKEDAELAEFESTVKLLSQEKILNLSGISNTDLKLSYGVGNLDYLSACDQYFTKLARTLYGWGNRLYDLGLKKEARIVLEYGIDCKTDISGHYTLLGEIYQESGENNKIKELIETASGLSSLMKDSIIRSLNAMLAD